MTSPLYTPKNSPDLVNWKNDPKSDWGGHDFSSPPRGTSSDCCKKTLECSRSKPYGTKQVKHKTLLEMGSRKRSVMAAVLQVFQVDAKKSKRQKMTEQKQCLAASGR